MKKIWEDQAWEEYTYWQTQDKKTLNKINVLLKDIDRNGYKGIGKPEALSGDLAGFWSRRIDDSICVMKYVLKNGVNEYMLKPLCCTTSDSRVCFYKK